MIESLLLAATLYTGKGAELPEYRGSHYTPRAERVLECLAQRESGWPRKGSWVSDGPYCSGAFQFIATTWKIYATRAGYPEWADLRAHKAPPYVQTEVAYVAMNPFPKKPGLEGLHHWSTDHTFELLGVRGKECSQ